jgi:hypothetical protein
MRNQKNFFKFGNFAFWVILVIIALNLFPFLNDKLYRQEHLSEWYNNFDTTQINIEEEDELKKDEKDTTEGKQDEKDNKQMTTFKWNWNDYDGRNCSVSFKLENEEFETSKRYRESYPALFFEGNLYSDFVKQCDKPISIISKALKLEMDKRSLSGIDRLNFVVSAIQTPPYTYIEMRNCKQGGDCKPNGCCPYVTPFAVYTPTEYVFQETGDCDTKSLIAYAILKKLNYNVAVMVGDTHAGPHAMLGVAGFPAEIPSSSVRHNGTIFQPWETTNFANEFQLGNMRMWRSWRNWKVVLN